jgi:hypothetical protein
MQSNREKNQAYDDRAQARVRPAPKEYEFDQLTAIMQQWRSGPAVRVCVGETNE